MLRQNKKPKQNKQKKKKNLLGKNEKTLVHKLCEKIRKNHESKRPKNSYKFIQASTNEPKTDVFSAFFFLLKSKWIHINPCKKDPCRNQVTEVKTIIILRISKNQELRFINPQVRLVWSAGLVNTLSQ